MKSTENVSTISCAEALTHYLKEHAQDIDVVEVPTQRVESIESSSGRRLSLKQPVLSVQLENGRVLLAGQPKFVRSPAFRRFLLQPP